MDISSWIGRHAAFSPRKTAIRFEGNQVSYGDFARQIGALAGVLHHRLGIRRGDRIAYLGQNHPDMLALLFACARLGAILMPMNWRLHRRELEQMLDDCGPSVLISDKTYNVAAGRNVPDMSLTLLSRLCSTTSAMHAHVPDSAGDAVLLCYTSGATGKPKGVVLDQHALLINALNSMHLHGLTAEDVVLTTLPMFHVGGLNILTLPILYAGGTLILHRVFDVDATFRALSDDKATLTVLVPTQIVAMMETGAWETADFSSLRMITTGSTLVARKLIRRVHARGVALVQVYGSTETCPIAAGLTAGTAFEHEGSAGLPALHTEIKIVDDAGNTVGVGQSGEILVRGGNVMRGYWNAPGKTSAALRDGWFLTGDMGHRDQNGFLFIDDRKKDMIISGGENIFPAEIENVLTDCPQIAEVAIIGQPDERWGEIVVAVVVPVTTGALTRADVAEFLKDRLARFKHPRRIMFSSALPRNAMGKVVKDDLCQQVATMAREKEGAGLT